MNGNSSICTTQPAQATSYIYIEDKPATSITIASKELDYKCSQEEISHLSGSTALPEIRAFECPGAFIRNLLSFEGAMIFYALYFYSVLGGICIYNDGNA